MRKQHLLALCLLVVSAFLLAACGSSGDSAESQIEDAIETSATTNDPANCTELETQNFSEQGSGESGKAAVTACEKEAKESSQADSVEITEVKVDGSKATANAAISGGNFDGQAVTIALVEEDGKWKLDELTGFVKFDQGALAKVFETQLEKDNELTPELTSCIVIGIEEAPQAEIEEIILSGNAAPVEELAESCASSASA